MLNKARNFDPNGSYWQITDGNYNQFDDGSFDLIQSIFTFDNIPALAKRINILSSLSAKLKNSGKIIMLDSTPEIYFNE